MNRITLLYIIKQLHTQLNISINGLMLLLLDMQFSVVISAIYVYIHTDVLVSIGSCYMPCHSHYIERILLHDIYRCMLTDQSISQSYNYSINQSFDHHGTNRNCLEDVKVQLGVGSEWHSLHKWQQTWLVGPLVGHIQADVIYAT